MINGRDALASIVEAMQENGLPIPESSNEVEEPDDYDPSDYHDPRFVLLSVEVGGAVARINVTMDTALVARLDDLAGRASTSRSALLAQGASMVLAANMAG